jgi:internalin A
VIPVFKLAKLEREVLQWVPISWVRAVPAETVSRPWRRFLRFSVRGMIVAVLLIGGWLGWIVRSARIQRDAVAAIRRADGFVLYDWEWCNGRKFPGKPWAPDWLIRAIGVDYFGRAACVTYFRRVDNFNEALLVERQKHPRHPDYTPPYFRVRVPGYDGAFAADLKSLADLSDLNLSSTDVTDDGLANFAGLTSLVRLNLEGTQITDAGLIQLERLTKIEYLALSGNRITDAGLLHLTGLAKLWALDLRDTQVTDSGLRHLERIPSLSSLDLRGTQVTDAGLKQLHEALPGLSIEH